MSWFPPRQRATVVGLKQVGLPFGGMLGAALMPALALRLGWRWAIAAGALAIVACAALCANVYRDPTGEAPLRRAAGQRGTVAEVLRSRDLWLVASATLVFAAMQTVWMAFLALYLQEFVGLALLAASRYLALAQAGGVLGRVAFGVLSDRTFGGRRRTPLVIAGCGSALCSLAIAFTGPGAGPWLLTPLALVFGFFGIGWNGVQHTLMAELAGPRSAGTAVGLGLAISSLGVTLGPPVFGWCVTAAGGYRGPWIGLSLVMLAGLGVLALVRAGGLVDQQTLDELGVRVVVDADADEHGHPRLTEVVVGDDGLRDPLVRDHDDVVLEHAEARGAPAHVHHVALDVLGREAHVVAHADRLVGQQVDAREEVRQRVLQGQGDREAAHAERGEDRRDGDAEGAEQHEATDHEDDQAHGRAEEPGDADGERAPLARRRHQRVEHAGHRHGDRQDDRGLEHGVDLDGEAGRQLGHLDGHEEAEHDAPEQRRQADRLEDQAVLRRALAGPAAEGRGSARSGRAAPRPSPPRGRRRARRAGATRRACACMLS